MRALELRRHAKRDPQADALSPAGRAQAQEVGRTLAGPYAVVFVSPAQRAAETVAWFLRSRGEQLPPHAVVPGLGGRDVDDSPEALGAVVRGLLRRVPDGARGLAVGHTPLIEQAVLGLTGRRMAPLTECEGVLLTEGSAHAEGDADLAVEELRLA